MLVARSGDRVIAFAEFHRSARRYTATRHQPQCWRDHHRGRTAAERLRHELYVPEDSGPALLCIRPGFRRGRARARWRHHQGRPLRARGRRAQALARSTGRSRVARATRQCGDVRSRGRCAAARRQRLRAQHLQDRSRAPLHLARAHASRARHAAVAVVQEDRLSTTMAPYIGTPTSRVDGFAKVTGAAKYAAEFNVPGLVYGSVVTSTIAKGRIARIDLGAALRVEGVLDVLTHENRPTMADNDQAYKDDVAPAGIAVPAALRRQDHVQRPADRARRRRNVGDRAFCGIAWCGWSTRRMRTLRMCIVGARPPFR